MTNNDNSKINIVLRNLLDEYRQFTKFLAASLITLKGKRKL